MAKGRNKKRPIRQRHATAPHAPLANSQHHKQQSDHETHKPWLSRLRAQIAAANKAVLAAIGVGLAGAVAAAVISLPHLVASKLFGSPSPLTAAGASAGNYPGSDPISSSNPKVCSLDYLGGTYLIPGTLHLPRTMSTKQLVALKNRAINADAGSTLGTYTLQANPGQTVVVTAIHVVVIRRVPAPQETAVEIAPPCMVASRGIPPLVYDLSVNLDAKRLSPALTEEGFNQSNPNQMIRVSRMQVVVTNGSPAIINFEGDTNKNDVFWEILIDYTSSGQTKTLWIKNESQPFHTISDQIKGDKSLTATLNSAGTTWTVQNGLK